MSDTYTTWLAKIADLCGTTTTQPNFVIEVPGAIDYAEERIYTDLQLIATTTADSTQACAPGNRNIAVPSAFVVVNEVNIITPAGTTPDNGKRNPLTKKSEAVLDFFWPDNSVSGVPTQYALRSQGGMLLGQWPDQGYVVEIVGTQRPAPLSQTNPTTFLTTNLPSLFIAASMIFMAGAKKNFGSQADDPRMAQSWENQYKELRATADLEELRKRYAGSSMAPPHGLPPAAPPQG